jgi:serine/threonine protein kinase
MTIQSLPPDTVLVDRYQIIRPLGRGGMGTLYLARDLRFERRYVALKENAESSPAAQEQFRLEAELLATLRHPHLPTVTDHFIDNRQFLVMDYVEGENLEETVEREGPLPEGRVLNWADQVLDALIYLHTQSPPIIHRDVKPANIRITPEGEAALVDFGVAKYMVPGRATATVARAGSPGYAPIEQYSGGTDTRSDLYSLGATLYLALTGHHPPESPAMVSRQKTLPLPRRLNPAISACTEAVILRAMRTNPEKRFQSAAEMRAALQGKAVRFPADPARIAQLSLGALVVIIVFVLLRWVLFERRSETPTPAPTLTLSGVVTTPATPAPESTSTPSPSNTTSPDKPTSTLRPTDTALSGKPTPLASTLAPSSESQVALPEPVLPLEGGEYKNPVTFQWNGSLSAGQMHQVTARHPESGYILRSELLTGQSWATELPVERYGEWRWTASVVQGGIAIATSSERMFWFNPYPGGVAPPREPSPPSSPLLPPSATPPPP